MIKKKCIILANGKPPAKSVFKHLRDKGYQTLICADGGANQAKKMNLIPQFIIGDLDSIKPETKEFYKEISNIIKVKSQDNTDVEKCLNYAIKKGFTEIILTGVTGDRLDHTFCNLSIVIKYSNLITLKVISENSILIPLKGIQEFKTSPNEVISIFALDGRTSISSKGLKYELNKTKLPFGVRESASNVALGDTIKLKINNGVIFFIRDYKKSLKYDIL